MTKRSFLTRLSGATAFAVSHFKHFVVSAGPLAALSLASRAETPSQVAIVLVSASAFEKAKDGSEPYELIQAIVDFVNGMIDDGYYLRQELPQKGMQAYHADFYLAQVNNGGHSQFIHNAGAAAEQTYADALAGLEAMGSPHADLLRAMIKWVADNPVEAGKQTGFEGGRSGYLDELDEKFYALSKESDIIKLSAAWILNWPELLIVDDAQLAKKMNEIYLANLKAAERKKSRGLRILRNESKDRLHIGVCLALASLKPVEWLVKIGGGSTQDLDGEVTEFFHVRSNVGKRRVTFKKGDLIVYEYIDPDGEKLAEIIRTEGFEAGFNFSLSPQYRKPNLGNRITILPDKEIANAIDVSSKTDSGAVIAALLEEIKQDTSKAGILALRLEEMPNGAESIRWLVETGEDSFSINTFPEGGIAYSLSASEFVGSISRTEVDEFVRRYN